MNQYTFLEPSTQQKKYRGTRKNLQKELIASLHKQKQGNISADRLIRSVHTVHAYWCIVLGSIKMYRYSTFIRNYLKGNRNLGYYSSIATWDAIFHSRVTWREF